MYIINGRGGSGGSGGSGNNFGGNWDDLGSPNNFNPFFSLFFGLILLIILYLLSNYAFKVIEEALKAIQNYCKNRESEKPNNLYNRLSVNGLRVLAIFMTLLTSPEAFALALRTFTSPWVRYLFRYFCLVFRFILLSSLFVGGLPFLLDWYKLVISFLSPIFESSLQVLGGSKKVALPILFIERLLKVIFTTIFCSILSISLKNIFISKRKLIKFSFLLGSVGVGVCVYLLVIDCTYIRLLSEKLIQNASINLVVGCQLGRFGLLIGSTFFLQNLSYLPHRHIFYIVFVYLFNVYYLSFSATSNLFPLKI